ncbi:MAG: sialate O-acetylesterase [Verrucomicrobiales bacterium]
MRISPNVKLSVIAALLALATLQNTLALDVYIVAGQSNGYRLSSLGQGDPAKPDQHKVYYYGMQYETTLPRLFWRFRHDIKPELPIVAGHIRELSDGRKAINRTLDKLAAEDPLFAVVPSNDLEFAADHEGKPNVHFALEGCLTLGERMAAALAKLIDSR